MCSFGRDYDRDKRQRLFVSEIQTYSSESMHAVKYRFTENHREYILFPTNNEMKGWLKRLSC